MFAQTWNGAEALLKGTFLQSICIVVQPVKHPTGAEGKKTVHCIVFAYRKGCKMCEVKCLKKVLTIASISTYDDTEKKND